MIGTQMGVFFLQTVIKGHIDVFRENQLGVFELRRLCTPAAFRSIFFRAESV